MSSNHLQFKIFTIYRKQCFIILAFCFCISHIFSQQKFPDIVKNKNGGISYAADNLGNQIPDFSYAGYQASEVAIPQVEAKIFLPKQDTDATQNIQAAINYVSNLKPNDAGFRGAVLLDEGTFKIKGTLFIKKSGIVLRGNGNNKTILLGTGFKREAIISVLGKNDKKDKDILSFSTNYTPLGSQKIQLEDASKLKVSDDIIIQKPLTQKLIDTLQMNDFGGETGWIGWKTRDWDIRWNRVVTSIKGNEVTLNAPLTMALDDNFGKAKVIKYSWEGRIEQIGIENLSISSTFDKKNTKDELHRWFGITMQNVKNAWVRQIHFKHLAGSAVSLLKTAQQITIEDCIATAPISEIAAFRRHTFYTEGEQTLFQRCYSEYGYHDFAVGGYATTGPNAFVQCESYLPYNKSGVIGSWATGVLLDIVNVDGNALGYANREQEGRGAGWSAANSVIWESSASKIENYSPPTAQNWAFGVWGGVMTGNGIWKDVNNHIFPRSLFYAQLKNRLGKLPVNPYVFPLGSQPTSSPTIAQAAKLNEEASQPAKTLKEWIVEISEKNRISAEAKNIPAIKDVKNVTFLEDDKKSTTKIKIKNGWLTFDEKVITGKVANVQWWRGSLKNHEIKNSSEHVTRFVPGRKGKGFTDDLEEVVNNFSEKNIVALEHNYGLWYERRMDDHERTRRIDTDVWAPFYEQPFARSGQGLAWDQLSKYDLTKYNDWYWYRLSRFSDLAESKGQILINQQYFQHNILEAGAHWSSSPWRSANNINNTGFPEPVPYAGDKRIFMADQFYDLSHKNRKELHQQFIRKSLHNFKDNSNVIQLTSAEYTGPLHFMEFWLDEVKKWKTETSGAGIIGLSATKDVQDAILNDSKRSKTVDLIHIRYWHYREDGSAYAPEGGKNLAPRQHARKMKTGKETEAQIYRAVREYRETYPEKAVLYATYAAPRFGWATFMAGGSLAPIPKIEITDFYKHLVDTKVSPKQNYKSDYWALENFGKSYLYYLVKTNTVNLDLTKYKGKYNVFWIDTKNGEVVSKDMIRGQRNHKLTNPTNKKVAVFVVKK
ncbi:DUF6298 domain-containing protein [Polaribacter sp.]|uniref:DUF6298 domain-containing protein n=1 Tax=Polaribacter sp. TaxID=1920175 RepID=UPI003F6CD6C9